ncbi:MAG: ergothioneine biosynthesis protein EgtB [Bacteroidetes bacterium]|nr:ergothioneine biosynthesis protein EgtB [Bacteroidota bacterium]
MNFLEQYKSIRAHSEKICAPLKTEDYVVQPVVDVSPPKWHLGHTTWFWETFVLTPHLKGYKLFNKDYNYVFNSYYETIGARVIRTDRGNLSRPAVEDVYNYRKHVDEGMHEFLSKDVKKDLKGLIQIGLNHEQQHQELLHTDIKYILGHNPLFPAYSDDIEENFAQPAPGKFIEMKEGVYEIGYDGNDFCFDNELNRHKVYLSPYKICSNLVTNGEYMQFINEGGYENFRYWHAEGLDWVKSHNAKAPLYWHNIEGKWYNYTMNGLKPVNENEIVTHINFYEASAYASWKGKRLPTEAEWEGAAPNFDWGKRWEWTDSAYLPYPGFSKAEGALGEYNGKFMINQMVLRGASIATPENHSRISYRNFFNPGLQWQYTGIRLAE